MIEEMETEEVDLRKVITEHNGIVDLMTGMGMNPTPHLALGLIMAGLSILMRGGMKQGRQMKIVQTTMTALQSLAQEEVKVKEGN
jgi:hypothetical protein